MIVSHITLSTMLVNVNKEVLVVRNDEMSIEGIEDLNPEKIVISPGPMYPK